MTCGGRKTAMTASSSTPPPTPKVAVTSDVTPAVSARKTKSSVSTSVARLDPDRARDGLELAARAVHGRARLVLAAARAERPADDDARLAGQHGRVDARRELAQQHRAHVGCRRGKAGAIERGPDDFVGYRVAVAGRERAVRSPRARDDARA